MTPYTPKSCTAFADTRRVASGDIASVASAVKDLADAGDSSVVLVFDDSTAEAIEFDLRGSAGDVAKRYSSASVVAPPSPDAETATDDDAAPGPSAPRSPGRPKLGVVGREVTLLPRHWEWLAAQPGGASVTLRKLVERARKEGSSAERARLACDATYRFAVAVAGNEPGFEEATRALYAGDRSGFEAQIALWPADVRSYARRLAAEAFHSEGE